MAKMKTTRTPSTQHQTLHFLFLALPCTSGFTSRPEAQISDRHSLRTNLLWKQKSNSLKSSPAKQAPWKATNKTDTIINLYLTDLSDSKENSKNNYYHKNKLKIEFDTSERRYLINPDILIELKYKYIDHNCSRRYYNNVAQDKLIIHPLTHISRTRLQSSETVIHDTNQLITHSKPHSRTQFQKKKFLSSTSHTIPTGEAEIWQINTDSHGHSRSIQKFWPNNDHQLLPHDDPHAYLKDFQNQRTSMAHLPHNDDRDFHFGQA